MKPRRRRRIPILTEYTKQIVMSETNGNNSTSQDQQLVEKDSVKTETGTIESNNTGETTAANAQQSLKPKKSKTPNSRRYKLLQQQHQLKENQYKALLLRDANYLMTARQHLSQQANFNDPNENLNTRNEQNTSQTVEQPESANTINMNVNSLLQMQQKRLTKMLQSTLNIYNNLPVLPKVLTNNNDDGGSNSFSNAQTNLTSNLDESNDQKIGNLDLKNLKILSN
jgi:hypothetical protein